MWMINKFKNEKDWRQGRSGIEEEVGGDEK